MRAYFLGETGSGADFVTPRLAGPMLLQKQTLDSTLAITGVNGNAPWLILEDATHHEFLFVWIGWTVDWGLRLLRNGDKVLLTCGTVKSSHELKPGEKLVSPRIYMGLVHGDLDDAVNAIHDQLRTVLPPTLKNYPWVTYNLWFTEPGDLEKALQHEADVAADLGVECFYHDASWYEGADTRGSGLWGQG